MKLKLKKIITETSDVKSFVFTSSEPLAWQAGQYLHYILPHDNTDSRGSDRWFTIASAPFEEVIILGTKFAKEKGSSFKEALASLKIDEDIEAIEPGGDFILKDLQKEYVFIAGGIGITPFRAILKDLDHKGVMPKIQLLYANSSEEIAYRQEIDAIAKKYSSLQVHYIISPDRISKDKIQDVISDVEKAIYYISGPEAMVENLGNTLKDMGIDKALIKQDWFPGYSEEY